MDEEPWLTINYEFVVLECVFLLDRLPAWHTNRLEPEPSGDFDESSPTHSGNALSRR